MPTSTFTPRGKPIMESHGATAAQPFPTSEPDPDNPAARPYRAALGRAETESMSLKSILKNEGWTEGQAAQKRQAKEAARAAKDGGEYRRACERCQHAWYVPAVLVAETAPTKGQVRAAKITSAGANKSLVSFSRGRKQAKVHHLEEQAQRVVDNNRCPECGSSSFTQELAGS